MVVPLISTWTSTNATSTASFTVGCEPMDLDLNTDGHVLGLEIIGARKHLPPALMLAILAHEDQTKNSH